MPPNPAIRGVGDRRPDDWKMVCVPAAAVANWPHARKEVVLLHEPVRTREVIAR
jgi:hypothetical protein